MPRAMNSKPICRGCVPPKLCLGVLSNTPLLNLDDWCLIVGSPFFSGSRKVGGRVIFGVAIDLQLALKGLSSCLVWNASVLPTTTTPPPPAGVQTRGLTCNTPPSEGRPFVQIHGDLRQEQRLTPASIRTPFLCPAKGSASRREFSRRNERFPRRP